MWLFNNLLYRLITGGACVAVSCLLSSFLFAMMDLTEMAWFTNLAVAVVFVVVLVHETRLDYEEYTEDEEDEEDEGVIAHPAMPIVPQVVSPVSASPNSAVAPASTSVPVSAPVIQQASAEEQEMLRREQEAQVTALSSAAENSRQASISEDEVALDAIESAAADAPIEEPPPYEDEEDYYYPPAEDYAEIFGNSGEN